MAFSVRVTEIPLEDRLFLIGPPGIGKTEVVMQKAEEEAARMGRLFVNLREEIPPDLFQRPEKYYVFLRVVAPHVFPEDLGLPKHADGYAEFLPPKALKAMTLKGIAGVLFIDELSNVQRDDQIAMYYSLILEKEAGWMLRISDGVKIIAAGNPPEWSEVARPIPKPLRNRLTIINVAPPTVEEWTAYMQRRYGDSWERLAALHLAVYPEDFLSPPPEDSSPFPTPRSWTSLAVLLHKHKNASDGLKEALAVGNLGEEVGARFAALLRTNLNIKEALRKLEKSPSYFDKLTVNQRLLLLDAVAQQPLDRLAGPLKGFLEHLSREHREMLVLVTLLMDREKRVALMKKLTDLYAEVAGELSRYV